jgi:thiamine pyrophosphate-dependent acetolactate synthase large subunit-like protein
MKKLYFLLLLAPFISLSQTTYYKYAPRKESTTVIKVENSNSQKSSQVNYAKVGQDFNNALNNVLAKREENARALGWSSAAEMDEARRAEKRRIRIEKALEKEERKRRKREEKEKEKALEKDKKEELGN